MKKLSIPNHEAASISEPNSETISDINKTFSQARLVKVVIKRNVIIKAVTKNAKHPSMLFFVSITSNLIFPCLTPMIAAAASASVRIEMGRTYKIKFDFVR